MTINASQNIMIDPNEPSILPDRTALTGRIEWFLYSLCLLDYENLPTPMSRIEEFANALITGEVPNIEPQSRVEEYFLAILTGDVENLPEPESRVEVLLNKLARGEFDLSDVEPIQSRYELLIAYLIKNGGMNDITYVLHEFLASDTPYTMYNTKEKPTKSAILKGCTLVNLCEGYTPHAKASSEMWYSNNGQYRSYMTSKIKSNTIYTIIIEHLGDRLSVSQSNTYVENGKFPLNGILKEQEDNPIDTKRVFTVQTLDEANYLFVTTFQNGSGIDSNVVIIEGDYTDVDIPYFTGMQSVKMPVLTTSTTLINYDVQFTDTGKDLISDFIKIPENIKGKILYPSFNTNKINENIPKQFGMETYDSNKQLLSRKGYWLNNCYSGLSPIILNEEVNYVKFEAWSCYELLGSNGKIGLTEMKNINYIPYKSNILTVNEEVELGSVGEVKDELNLLTGQLTQRTETRAYQEGDESNSEVLTDMTNTRYKLPKEAIKTVDLSILDQDGATVEKLNTFKDITHVSCSVDEGSIYPYVEMEVATSNDEDLAAIGLKLEEKNKVQSKLIKVNDYQSDVIDNVMLGITEIYESI